MAGVAPRQTVPRVAAPVLVARQAAVDCVTEIAGNWIARLLNGRRRAVSAELVYLPWWLFTYRVAVGSKPHRDGRIAVEPRSMAMAAVPDDSLFAAAAPAGKWLPAADPPDPVEARRAIWFEVLGRERRRSAIDLVLVSSRLVHLPYWVVYTQGRSVEALPVDASNGKLDLVLRDAVVAALLEYRASTC